MLTLYVHIWLAIAHPLTQYFDMLHISIEKAIEFHVEHCPCILIHCFKLTDLASGLTRVPTPDTTPYHTTPHTTSASFLDATIAKGLHLPHDLIAPRANVLRLLRVVHHQRHPTNGPEYQQEHPGHRPRFEGRERRRSRRDVRLRAVRTDGYVCGVPSQGGTYRRMLPLLLRRRC